MYFLRSDQIRCILLRDIYPLIQPFNSYIGGGGQQYFLLLARSLTERRVYYRSSTWPDASLNLSSVLQKVTSGTLAMWKLPRVYLIQVTRAEVLIYQCYATQSEAPPSMLGGICLCLSGFVLLVNKSNYWLEGREKTTYILKPYFIVQEK